MAGAFSNIYRVMKLLAASTLTLSTMAAMALVPARVLARGFSSSAATAFVRPATSNAVTSQLQTFSGRPKAAPSCRTFHTLTFSSDATTGISSQRLSCRLNVSPSSNNNHNDNQGRPATRPTTNGNNSRFPPRRRYYNSNAQDDHWEVPKSIDIPVEKIDLSFSRASGAGGQNVNKVSTKVELRFQVLEAEWIPLEVRQRLYEQQRGRINKKGVLSVQSQEFRTQEKNRKAAVSKLEGLILEAYVRPKERKLRKGVSKAAKERNKETKRKRSQVKQSRRQVSSRDW